MIKKILYLSWQNKRTRLYFPVGRLDVLDSEMYVFRYIKGAEIASETDEFIPLLAFPQFDRVYVSRGLFPTFTNRIMAKNRPERSEYLASMGLDDSASSVDVLSINGGKRATDTYQVFPKLVGDENGNFVCRFFLHGWRYADPEAQTRINSLVGDDKLQIQVEPDNLVDKSALKILTTDQTKIGYVPRYFIGDLRVVVESNSVESLSVVKVNKNHSIPKGQRVLIEMKGNWGIHKPMESEKFQPLVEMPESDLCQR